MFPSSLYLIASVFFIFAQACPEDLVVCSKSFLEATANRKGSDPSSSETCPEIGDFFSCLRKSTCGLGKMGTANDLLDASLGRMEDLAVRCPRETRSTVMVTEIRGTIEALESYANLMKAVALFWRNGCYGVLSCLDFWSHGTISDGEQPSCPRLQTSGVCMFKACRTMRGTDHLTEAANALIEFYKGEDNRCNAITVGELINQGIGTLQGPGWESRGLVLAAVVSHVICVWLSQL